VRAEVSNSVQNFSVYAVILVVSPLLEAEGIIPSLRNIGVMRNAIPQRGGHFGIAEHGHPFREGHQQQLDKAGVALPTLNKALHAVLGAAIPLGVCCWSLR